MGIKVVPPMKLGLKSKLLLLITLPLAIFVAVAGVSRYSIGRLATGDLVRDKDLIADILPPPTYLIESYLLTLQACDEANAPELQKLTEAMALLEKEFGERCTVWDQRLPEPELHDAFLSVREKGVHFLAERNQKLMPLLVAHDYSGARKVLQGSVRPAYQAHRNAVDMLVKLATDHCNKAQGEVDALIQFNNILIIAGPLLAITLLAVLGWWVIHGSISTLRSVTGELDQRVGKLSSSSAVIATSAQALADHASHQAASLEETSASMEELSSMTRGNADNAQKARSLAAETQQAAEHSRGSMDTMALAMQEVKQASENVSKIIRTIDEIAFQTNILALNAAVEAARAGEAGAGFAVVAEEVRALAQRSANAARETGGLLAASVQSSERGVTLTEDVRLSLVSMVEQVSRLAGLVDEIATSCAEQAKGITQINVALSDMDKATQDTAARTEETASTGRELDEDARSLSHSTETLTTLIEGRA